MRIVGGKHKGRNLIGPASEATRPTSDRVRESLFNILAHGIEDFELEGARVMDLFAGTGALGFEALSRGAKFCQFVEEDTEARGVIRKNADAFGVIGLCKIWRRDATDLGSCAPQSPYDLIFADPPYGKGLGEKALRSVFDGGWLSQHGVIVLEESDSVALEPPSELTEVDQRTYGETKIFIFKRRSPQLL